MRRPCDAVQWPVPQVGAVIRRPEQAVTQSAAGLAVRVRLRIEAPSDRVSRRLASDASSHRQPSANPQPLAASGAKTAAKQRTALC